MKNSKTKKLLATIALTSMSFNTNLVLAGPKGTAKNEKSSSQANTPKQLEICYLSNIYQYLKPEDKQKFPLINKKCLDAEITGNYANQWCRLLNILKCEGLKEYVDKEYAIPVTFVEEYFGDFLKKIYKDNFIEKLHNSTKTYRLLDSSDSSKQNLENELRQNRVYIDKKSRGSNTCQKSKREK